ncbi:putative baseplate wedge protein [Synechococcus phage S-CBWM1]|uniref:Putative baseplate wedge protein n=1 Tax=Synechococcus phage S-CBWM1 TaxID=2053653 RepID=A0A3G1L3S6_9CAUD|nr:putative baseplate wedge protein [Synechococcus phage S-CBWM1]ATW62800.1 putative baseplate wedge protein [Synechococcus phage S-CBWM1]
MSSAHKFHHKTSDVPGDRPTNQVLDPAEIGLNTEPSEPGIFFRTSDGNVVKAGPAIVSTETPRNLPERGEVWYDLTEGTAKIGSTEEAKKVWRTIASPFMGGGERVVFVAPEFPYANDTLGNDGQSLPYKTVIRASIELTKIFIQDTLTKSESERNSRKYTIFYAPSRLSGDNSPGPNTVDFNVRFPEDPGYEPGIQELVKFNAESGGVIIPGNFSLIGMDSQKCEIHPSYVPSYAHPALPPERAGVNQPITAIFKVGLRAYFENFRISDQLNSFEVYKITSVDNDVALLHSRRPHTLSQETPFAFSYSSNFDRQSRLFKEGVYIAEPIDTFTLRLIDPTSNGTTPDLNYVRYSNLVPPGSTNEFKLLSERTLYSNHRLRCFREASISELSQYFVKVQRAFLSFFGGQVAQGADILLRSQALTEAYADPKDTYSFDFFRSIHVFSDYGLCGGEIDGSNVGEQFSLRVQDSSIDSIQLDPAAYEIYTTLLDENNNPVQKWWPLIDAAYRSISTENRPESLADTPREAQLSLLRETPVERIRYHYGFLSADSGKSLGLVNLDEDFRHFGLRIVNSGNVYTDNVTTRAAVGIWGLNGGNIFDTNSESQFGSIAIRSEGFRGVGTLGGANQNLKGFQFSGIYAPLALTRKQVEDNANKKILSLGGRIVDISIDPSDPNVQLVKLSCDFFPSYILPYSLKPNTAIWVTSGGCTYRGFLASDGGPTVIRNNQQPCPHGAILRIRLSDSTIPTDSSDISAFDIPYLRRFSDPRNKEDTSYRLVVSNTSPDTIAPSVGSILRLDQTSQGIGNPKVRPNVQFDPGVLGGWGRVFSVNDVDTVASGRSPNFNYVVSDGEQDSKYLVTLSASDYCRPWLQDHNHASGMATVRANRNWYAAENNYWTTLYHDSPFSENVGPLKLAPAETSSPFVPTAPLERGTSVGETFQGNYSSDSELARYSEEDSYLRGYTVPFTQYPVRDIWDYDDGSEGLGIILKRTPSGNTTNLISAINQDAITQEAQAASESGRYRPEIVKFRVLSPKDIINPRQNVSVLLLQNGPVKEYLQVINLIGSEVEAIRLDSENSLYLSPSTSNKPVWEGGSQVQICTFDSEAEPESYDPIWSNSKASILRFFEVMGYSRDSMSPSLTPKYWGEREIPQTALPQSPDIQGYALETAEWPLEFNEPSTVISISHSWNSCGYLTPSRGLRINRSNTVSRKLGYDFLAYSSWGGRLIVNGVNESGEQITLGPQREALTAQFVELETHTRSLANQQIYEDQSYVEFPNQVVVYTADDISGEFDNARITYSLTKGGFPVPLSHLSESSVFVQLGSVTQRPGIDYTLIQDSIRFTVPPQQGLYCDIRIVTTEDQEKTLVVAEMDLAEPFDGSRSTFTMSSEKDIRLLDIDYDNLLVFLGGILQQPEVSYFLTRDSASQLTISFTEVIPAGTSADIRAICTNSLWASQGIFPVALYSLDNISQQFDNSVKEFELKYQGSYLNPSVVNSENVLASIGGVIQIPGYSYEVKAGRIIFSEAPPLGATSEIRVITNSHFLPCLNSRGRAESFLYWGPSVIMNLENELNLLKTAG